MRGAVDARGHVPERRVDLAEAVVDDHDVIGALLAGLLVRPALVRSRPWTKIGAPDPQLSCTWVAAEPKIFTLWAVGSSLTHSPWSFWIRRLTRMRQVTNGLLSRLWCSSGASARLPAKVTVVDMASS